MMINIRQQLIVLDAQLINKDKLMSFIFIILFTFLTGQDSTLVLSNEFNNLIIDTKIPDISLINPNGNESFLGNEIITVEWTADDDYFSNETDSEPISIQISTSQIDEFETITPNISNSGFYNLTLPLVNTDYGKINIIATDYFGNSNSDASDSYFQIESIDSLLFIDGYFTGLTIDTKRPELIILNPNGGEDFNSEEQINIEWFAFDDSFNSNSISAYISTDLNNDFQTLFNNAENTGSRLIDLPNISTSFAQIKMIGIDSFGNQFEDITDDYFTINANDSVIDLSDSLLSIAGLFNGLTIDTDYPQLQIIHPNGGEEFNNNENITVNWIAEDNSLYDQSISIYLSTDLDSSFNPLIEDISNTGEQNINLPYANTSVAKIQLSVIDLYGNQTIDESDNYFQIGTPDNNETVNDSLLIIDGYFEGLIIDTASPIIEIISPNGGEQYNDMDIITVEWNALDDSFNESAIDIYLSNGLGEEFNLMEENLPNSLMYDVQLPEDDPTFPFSMFKLIATDMFGNSSTDYGDNYFYMYNVPNIEAYTITETTYLESNQESVNVGFFVNILDDDLTITLYQWDFDGDGLYDWSSTTTGSTSYSYSTPGEYNVQLTVTDSDGYLRHDYITVFIEPFELDISPVDELVSLNWGFGPIQTVLIDNEILSNFMVDGDQLHIIDDNGIAYNGCSLNNTTNPVSVGSIEFQADNIGINSIACYKSYNNCDPTGDYSWDYMNAGEYPDFVVYDHSEDKYYNAILSQEYPYQNMTYHFTDFLTNGEQIFMDSDFEFGWNQSTSQSFYFIIDAAINGEPLESDDIIATFREGICVGYRKWLGIYTDIPAMGNDGGRSFAGFVQGNDMKFRYYSQADGIFYDLTPTFSQGDGVFGNHTTVVSNFEITEALSSRKNHNINILNNNPIRDDFYYNIYRDEELLIENYTENYYFDQNISESGNYCYEISLIDNSDNEILNTQDQCVEINIGDDVLIGDINGDTFLNIVDVIGLVSIILNDLEYNVAADINQDNAMNIVDVIMLVDWILNS